MALVLAKARSDHRLKCRNTTFFYKLNLFLKFETNKKIIQQLSSFLNVRQAYCVKAHIWPST